MEIHVYHVQNVETKGGSLRAELTDQRSSRRVFLHLYFREQNFCRGKKTRVIRPLGFSQRASELTTSQGHARNHFILSYAKSPTTEIR